jgi:SAM-dependent methyltransferase
MELAEYRRMHALEERHWWFRAKRRMVYALLRAWAPAGGRVLDVGCGTGITLQELPSAYRGVGLDPSSAALALCRGRGLASLVRGSATELPLADASVDAVLALDIVEHIEEDRQALLEIARVLRRGGVGVITVPAFPFLWSAHDEALHHKRRYTRATLERAFHDAGLSVRVGGFGQGTIFPAVACLRLGRRWLGKRSGSRDGSGGGTASDVRETPSWLNAVVYRLIGWEVPLIRRGWLPVGLSLVYVVSPASRAAGAVPYVTAAFSGDTT